MPNFLTDSFTGAAGTALTAHAPEIGGTWNGSAALITAANRVRSTGYTTSYNSTVSSSNDYYVTADVTILSEAGSWAGISLRAPSAETGYSLLIKRDTGQLWLYNGGTLSLTPLDVTPGNTYRLTLQARGTTIIAFVDGVAVATVTNTQFAGPGLAGLWINQGSDAGDAGGLQIDNFAASTDIFAARTVETKPLTNILFSPYNWNNGQTTNGGAYFKTSVIGAPTVALLFNPPAVAFLKIKISLNGAAWREKIVPTSNGRVYLSGLNAAIATLIEVVFSSTYTSWGTAGYALILTGIEADATATLTAPAPRPKRGLIVGDSITNAENSVAPNVDDATIGYSFFTMRGLDCEYGVVAYGSQGFNSQGHGAVTVVPKLIDAYKLINLGVSRSFAPAPDFAIVNHGTNGTTTMADVTNFIDDFRANVGNCPLLIMIPFGNTARAAITAAVAARPTDTNLYLVDVGTTTQALITTPRHTVDGVHPNQTGHALAAAATARAVQAILSPLANAVQVRGEIERGGGMLAGVAAQKRVVGL